MASRNTKAQPQAGEIWLTRPPYLFLAHILEVDEHVEPPVVSYLLHDEDGLVLERISRATLDRGWWHAFQPMERRYG
jgi:hypothetical protein